MEEEKDPVARRSDLSALSERLEGIIRNSAEETRRHFDIVAEQMRADFKVVADKTVATAEKVDRLIARNAIEHAAFVDCDRRSRGASASPRGGARTDDQCLR